MSSLQEELQSSSSSRQELEGQAHLSQQRQRELERQVEEGERSRQEMQGAAQQGKAAEVQMKALQARLTQATEATASIGRDLAEARTQVSKSSCTWWQLVALKVAGFVVMLCTCNSKFCFHFCVLHVTRDTTIFASQPI